MVTWIKLHDKVTDREIYFFNTHLDHVGPEARKNGSRLIGEAMRGMPEGAPAILTGDFNALPDDPVLGGIYNYFPSAREHAPVTDYKGTFNGFRDDLKDQVIDHIYYSGFVPSSFRTLDGDYGAEYISDHYPVEAVFSYDNN